MRDLVDVQRRYAANRDFSSWSKHVVAFLDRYVLPQLIPAGGYVVELGTAHGDTFRHLCDLFGNDRCVGIDVVNYSGHPRVRERDVRTLDRADDLSVAFGWNDLSDWKLSPASKRAGLEFLVRNLVRGGYYLDAGFTGETLVSLDLSDLELVVERDSFKLWRRVRGGPEERPSRAGPAGLPRTWWQWFGRMCLLHQQPFRVRRRYGMTALVSPVDVDCGLTEARLPGAKSSLSPITLRPSVAFASRERLLIQGHTRVLLTCPDTPGAPEEWLLRLNDILCVPPEWFVGTAGSRVCRLHAVAIGLSLK